LRQNSEGEISYRSGSTASLKAFEHHGQLVEEAEEKNEAEFDLNISFSGGYIPNTDLSRVDKGQGNP